MDEHRPVKSTTITVMSLYREQLNYFRIVVLWHFERYVIKIFEATAFSGCPSQTGITMKIELFGNDKKSDDVETESEFRKSKKWYIKLLSPKKI